MSRAAMALSLVTAALAALLMAASAHAKLVPGSPGFGAAGADPGTFMQPGGVAFTSAGEIWVADTGNGRVQRFTRTGALSQVVNGFVAPTGIAVGPDDAVYVADAGAGAVTKLLPDGTIDPSFSQTSLPDARALAVDPRGEDLFVVEGAAGRLDRLSAATGAVTQLVVESGLASPSGVAVDAGGTIAVAEQGADRVFVLDADGGAPTRFGVSGSDPGNLDRPGGVAFDPYGSVVVADTGNGRVQRFTAGGSLIDGLGGLGAPVAVASDAVQSFAVVDTSGAHVLFVDDVLPPPVLGQTANVARLEGTVTVRAVGGAPRPLTSPQQIRFGAEIDTRKGTLRLVTARATGGIQQATLFGGQFTVRQPASGVPTTTLSGDQLASCPARSSRAAATRLPDPEPPQGSPRRVVRTRVKGQFRTNGSTATANVKGTDYRVADYCSGTVVTVFAGVVSVTRRADGAGALVRGTLARPGRIFVKAPARHRTAKAERARP